jgi:hypothetical protein
MASRSSNPSCHHASDFVSGITTQIASAPGDAVVTRSGRSAARV